MPATRSSLPPRRLMLLAAALLAPSLAIIVAMFLSDLFKSRQCPAGSVLWGTNQSGHLAVMLPVLVMPIFLAGWLAITGMARRGQSVFGIDPLLFRRAMGWLLPVVGAGWLMLTVNGAFAGFCATPQTVSYREGVFAPVKTYAWSDVVRVVATCRHISGRQSHDDVGYWLVMQDGRQIDLGYAEVPTATLVKVADSAMRGVPHSYDASRVSASCDPMRTRPLLADAVASR